MVKIRISERKNKRILIFPSVSILETKFQSTNKQAKKQKDFDFSEREYLRNLASEYEKRAKLGGLSGIK